MGAHLIEGQFQSDKYPTCPRGKVPLSVEDKTAQDLLWEYAKRRRPVDAEFTEDLQAALLLAGFEDPGSLVPRRRLPRDQRQQMIASWAEMAFGREKATGLPHRGLRLLEEAVEAFQACGGEEALAHKLVTFVFEQQKGTIGQELGGVAVAMLALAAAAGISADEEECREIDRVLGKPLREFTERDANKDAAGFKLT